MTLTTLPPGTQRRDHRSRSRATHDATTKLDVPGPGKELAHGAAALESPTQLARVKLVSDPVGAQVVQNGQLLAGVTTPAEVLVEAGKSQRFMLTLPNKRPGRDRSVHARPRRDRHREERQARPRRGAHVESTATDGKVTVTNAPHCRDLASPAECMLAPGTYSVDFVATGAARSRAR